MPEYARRVNLSVAIDGHDVAGHFAPYLLDFTYTDNASGKADEVRLTLHNRDGQFTGAWKPRKGMPIEAAIICEHWQEQGQELQLPCGSFKIDEIEFSGPPDKVQIKAVSADLTGPLRDTRKTRAWENMSLEELAGQIAGENGLKLYYSGPEHKFERQDQRNEGDIAFLNRLCGERSMHCKVHSGHLAVFDADEAESAGAVMSIAKTGGIYSPTSYSFKMSSSGTDYKSADVAYTDPKTGTTHKAKVKSVKKTDTTDSSGKTLTLNRRVENASQAMALGKSELRKANSKEQTASLEIMGCPLLAAGQMLELTGFGDFSGKYFIKTATHKISGSGGYKTSLELTAPAPTEAGSAHDEVNEAAIEARQSLGAKQTEALNEEADKNAREGFEELLQRLPEALSEIEELLLCLPEIAAAEAGRTTDKADKQGWLYLEKMFYRWFGGKANEDALKNNEIFWVNLDWVLKYGRVNAAFWQLASSRYLLRPAAKSVLTNLLKREKLLPCTQKTYFDFTNKKNHIDWENDYFQYIDVDGMSAFPPDGLMAAMGTFVLRALAKGYIDIIEENYIINVTGISIYLRDSFNFIGDATLGYWQCDPPLFMSDSAFGGKELANHIFRLFRQTYSVGNDFLVLSQPKTVDPFPGFIYEVSL